MADPTISMADPVIKVVATDLELGDTGEQLLRPGQFVVVCAEPLRVTYERRHRNGTVVLVLKGGGGRG